MRTLALLLYTVAALASTKVEGLVVEVEQTQGLIVIAHKPTRTMSAMTMPFRVARAAQLDGIKPGMRIRFHLARGSAKISDIEILKVDFGEGVRVPDPANKLHIGDLVPEFELTDQNGQPVGLRRGVLTVVNFIYTRCPMPEVCPRLSATFAYLSKKLPEARLLTITLDPAYDTPAVLREYAGRFNASASNWHLLTGDEAKIREIGGLFGLVYWPEDGVITHTSTTAVIGRDGRLKASVEGTAYRADQLLALVTHFFE